MRYPCRLWPVLLLFASLKPPNVSVYSFFCRKMLGSDLRNLRVYTYLITFTHFHFSFLLKQIHLLLVRDSLKFEFLIILLFLFNIPNRPFACLFRSPLLSFNFLLILNKYFILLKYLL